MQRLFSNVKQAAQGLSSNWRYMAITVGLSGAILGSDSLTRLLYSNESTIAVVHHENIGKPKLGGSWSLINALTGGPVSSSTLQGKYLLMYFGFSFCPDICPQELDKIAEVRVLLKKKGITSLKLVFVTIDPKRDSCAQLARYVNNFPGQFLALTGSPTSIKRVSRLFRVYYNDSVVRDADDYLIDHSIIHYLIGPSGEFLDFFGKNLTAAEICEKIEGCIKK